MQHQERHTVPSIDMRTRFYLVATDDDPFTRRQ